jgi:UDP-N-acetyl-D-glucosamine dehydrogenase
LPLALLFSEQGFPVVGFDIDGKKVQILTAGGSYIYRVPPTEIQIARSRGFTPTADFARIADVDAILVCVPTPLDEHRQPDLSYVTSTIEAIAWPS